jgi:hypothetical protein
MNLNEARKIARAVEEDHLRKDEIEFGPRFDELRAAHSKLLWSDPATAALRREDLRLANVVMKEVGKAVMRPEQPRA